jgi:hypothetical protein
MTYRRIPARLERVTSCRHKATRVSKTIDKNVHPPVSAILCFRRSDGNNALQPLKLYGKKLSRRLHPQDPIVTNWLKLLAKRLVEYLLSRPGSSILNFIWISA